MGFQIENSHKFSAHEHTTANAYMNRPNAAQNDVFGPTPQVQWLLGDMHGATDIFANDALLVRLVEIWSVLSNVAPRLFSFVKNESTTHFPAWNI